MFTLAKRQIHTSNPLHKIIPFVLADIGEGINEVEVLQWYTLSIKRKFDKIAEVQSDKASVDISSRFDGKIVKLHYKSNETAVVGKPLIDIDVPDDQSYEPAHPEPSNKAKDDRAPMQSTANTAVAMPAVRSFAKARGVDLNNVSGSGENGQVMMKDVEDFLNKDRSKLTAYQKAMVKTMEKALKIPHFGYSDEIDVSKLAVARKKLKLTFLPFIVKAISDALAKYPIINSHYKEDGGLRTLSEHNIGIAIDTAHGLVVPVVKNTQTKTVSEISSEIEKLQQQASNNRLSKEQLEGGTLTLSNIGSIGGIHANPVLLSPQICIGAISRARLLPRYNRDGQLVASTVIVISWSADHRILDGATVARFSNQVKDLLENPEKIN